MKKSNLIFLSLLCLSVVFFVISTTLENKRYAKMRDAYRYNAAQVQYHMTVIYAAALKYDAAIEASKSVDDLVVNVPYLRKQINDINAHRDSVSLYESRADSIYKIW